MTRLTVGGEMFRAALDAVVVMDAAGVVRDWNPAAQTTFGYTREEAVGREVAELIVPGPLRRAHRDAISRFVQTRESSLIGRRIELSALNRDGAEFPVELAISLLDEAAEPPLFIGFVRDLRERETPRLERDRLQQRMAFLAQAGLVLDQSLEYGETLHRLADLTVPELAQLAVIDLVDPDGSIQAAVAAATHVEHARELEEMRVAHPLDLSSHHPVAEVLRSGQAMLLPAMDSGFLARIAQGGEHLELMRRLQYHTAIVVPLVARQHRIGTLSLLRMRGAPSYDHDDLVLAADLARRAAMAVDNARMFESTRRLARTLQESLLPRELPEIPGVQLVARYLAAQEGQEVGGDFYDVFAMDEDRWGIAIGDVCGKGADAAALTALARYTIRALAGPEPASVLQRLNDSVMREAGQHGARFMTVLFGIASHTQDGLRIEFAAAGHPPPLILNADGTVERIRVGGPLIGVQPGVRYGSAEVVLRANDTMLLYTDGLTDARAPKRILTETDLAELLASAHGLASERLARFMEQCATAGERPRDDIALLVISLPRPQVSPLPALGASGRLGS